MTFHILGLYNEYTVLRDNDMVDLGSAVAVIRDSHIVQDTVIRFIQHKFKSQSDNYFTFLSLYCWQAEDEDYQDRCS